DFPRLRETFEALDRDEAVDLRQERPQALGGIQVRVGLSRARLRLKNHGNHFVASVFTAARNVPSTVSTNVRSSRRISRCPCANATFARPSGSALMRAR